VTGNHAHRRDCSHWRADPNAPRERSLSEPARSPLFPEQDEELLFDEEEEVEV
jgi:hypothetical protein